MAKFLVQAEVTPAALGSISLVVNADDSDAAEAIALEHLTKTTTAQISFVHTVREAGSEDTTGPMGYYTEV